MTPEQIKSASEKVERLTHKLDITNADHIALWLEANMDDSSLAWLACRIIEAHEATLTAREAVARADEREKAAKGDTYAAWQQKRGMLADTVDWAILEYDEFMKDDAYDAQRVLDRIIERLRSTRSALAEKQP